ncbi:MAG: ABC transporter permease [Actinomycetota bacterium]|nr:ABC transporter permease [Actinomycetota bacterium]
MLVEQVTTVAGDPSPPEGWAERHAIAALVLRRGAIGVLTLFVVSVLIFVATEVLPGNAAYAVLGHTATPARIKAIEDQLHLNRSIPYQYWSWISGVLSGHPGRSFADGQGVWSLVAPRLVNSAVLVVLAGVIGTLLGVVLGAVAALRKDSWFDHLSSVVALAVTSLPEFVVAIALIILFSTVVLHLLPAVSLIPPGTYSWSRPELLVLPTATLVLVIVPYILRMMRAAMVEALESDYVEMARLEGLRPWRVTFVHALPNAIAPTVQVIGLNFLYLAGGIVIVEDVFNYPGIGQGLVNAVNDRDIPTIQLIVVILAAFYVFVNIASDVVALLASPRRRLGR